MRPGLKPGAMPRAKVGDFDTALELLTVFGSDKARKEQMTALRAATAEHDTAREASEAAERKMAERESAAQTAEADAIRVRQRLVDETTEARAELGQRETAVAERERLAGECEKSQEARDTDLARRETHLKSAGVRGF